MKHTFKRLTAIFLTLCMLLSVLPFGVFAASDPDSYVFDITEGTIQILDGDTAGKIKVRYGSGLTTPDFDPSQEITVTGTFVATGTKGKSLKVETNLPVTVRIRDLTIDNGLANYYQAMALFGSAANVTLILEGTNYLRGGRDCGGIEVGEGKTLTIKGDGVLTAQGAIQTTSAGAGIGGHVEEACGNIVIESGTVTAIGGENAAGIGGGGRWDASSGGNGGKVVINGGTVTATGGSDGAGIGGGQFANGGILTINGGTVFAKGGENAAGIGGGRSNNTVEGKGGTVIISGGTVTAIGGGGRPDIGGGYYGTDHGSLTVDGEGWVTAANIGGTPALTRGVVNGVVYGDVTLTADRTIDDLTIPAGTSLTVSKGKTLTVNGTVTNSGTLSVFDDSSLAGTGSLTGSGSFVMETPEITVASDLEETGAVLDPAATLGGSGFSFGGAAFTVDTTGWTGPVYDPAEVKDAGEYTVSFTKDGVTISKTFTVGPKGPQSYYFDISKGSITVVDGDTPGMVKVEYGGGLTTPEFDPSQVITVTGTGSNKSLVIDTATPVTIKASNLTINNAYANYVSPMLLRNDAANVTLVLEGENLIVGGRDQAGIVVETGRTLTITGSGSVEARGEDHSIASQSCGAGIGGRVNNSCGTVIIESGTVTAIGGDGAAGIGGGSRWNGTTGNGGNVTINGGTVTAIGNGGGADIGGGKDTVNTGTLTVDGDAWVTAANIGGTKTLTRGVVNGTVYGDITLTEDLTVDNLTIAVGATLTVPEGVTLTVNGTVNNSGTLSVFDDSSLAGEGSLAGDGSFLAKAAKITVASDLVETGEELDPAATLDGFVFTFGGKDFTSDATGWTGPVYDPAEVKDAGEYTVSFTKDGVTVSKTFTVDCELDFVEGEMGDTKRVTYNTVLGDVPASEKEGYTFEGWITAGGEEYDPTAPVLHSATYYARYTPNVYTITYGDETMDVTFGEPFTVPEATGIGENQTFYAWFGNDGNIYLAGATYTYTLAGDLELNPLVDTDTTYWTVKFIGEDGYLFRVELVEQTEDATVDMPVYWNYPQATWVCGGVEYIATETVPVSGDMTFTVNAAELHTVRFVADGYLVSEQRVRDGDMVQYVPAVPAKDGYDGEWSVDLDFDGARVYSDMTVTAVYTAKQYKVMYFGVGFSGVPSATQEVTYGKTFFVQPYTGNVPDGMRFYGWVSKQGDVFLQTTSSIYDYTGNLSLAPLFDKDTKYWTVKLVGEDGAIYDVELVEQKSDAKVTLPEYAEYPAATWLLDNADGLVEYNADSVVPVTGDTTFMVKAPAKHTVTFMANGYLVAQYTVREGEALPTVPAVPAKEGYMGTWGTVAEKMGTSDLVYTASYTPRSFVVRYTFTRDGSAKTLTHNVPFGSSYEITNYTGDVPDGQNFLGWSGSDGNFYLAGRSYTWKTAASTIMKPVFEGDTEYWTVNFIGEDGYLYRTELVEQTEDATVTLPVYAEYPAATWMLGNDEYNAGSVVPITGDTTFSVNAPAKYTVTFMANGYQVAQYSVRDGETLPEVPAVPEKYGYTGEWDADTDAAITADTVIEAAYTANEYTIYYYNENLEVYYEEDVTFGDWFTPAEFDGTVPDGMKFLGWNGDDGQFFLAGELQRLSVASDLYLLPVFAADTEYWTVKFCHPDGSLENVYLVEQAAINGAEFFIADKEYSLYPDAEWMLTSGDVDEVAVGELVSTNYITVRSDVVFTAVVPDTYTILFYSEEGYLMDARFIMENELIGAGPEAPAKEGYTFVGWQDENGDLLDDATVATQDMTYRPVYEANEYPITLVPSEHVQLGILPETGIASVGDVITIGTLAEAGFETYYVCVYYQNAAGEMVPVAISPLPANAPYDTPDMNGYTFVMPAGPVTVQVVEQANRNTAKFLVDSAIYGFEYILSGETPAAPVEPVKEGYTFLGWKALSTGTEYPVGAEFDPIYADETYVALYEINTYDLTYYRGEEADASEFKCILALPDGTFVEFFNNDTTNMPTYVIADITYGDTVVLAEPMLPGYVFKGWVDESGYMHPAGAKYTMPAGDVLLTAVWEKDSELSCLVRFVDGGKLYDAYLAYDGQDASIPAVDPTADGKTFIGWKYDENTYSNTGVKDFTVAASDAREMTFEAVWEDILYTVSYTDYAEPADYTYGTELVTLPAPEQEGYTFVAWQCAENGAYYFANTAFTVKSNMTFSAVWAKNDVEYTVKFFDESGNLVDVLVAEEGAELIAPAYEQGREDAEYLWLDAEHNTYLREGESFTAAADCSYRATLIDEAQYPVSIYVESDDGELDNVATADKNEYLLGETVYVKISVPEGYVLKAVSAAGASNELLPIKDSLLPMGGEDYLYIFEMPAAPVVVLVELEKIPAGCTAVKFVSDGDLYDYVIVQKGSNGFAPETVPVKDGYNFVRWSCGTSFVEAGGEFAVSSDAEDEIVYTAVWEAIDYMVEYRPDGGTPDPEDVHELHYGDQITLAAAPVKAGYTFLGWVEESTGFLYGEGCTYTVKGDAVFTAKWEQAECVVRFLDPNSGIIYGYEALKQGERITAPAAPTVSGKTFLYWVNAEDNADRVFADTLTPALYTDTVYHAVFATSRHSVSVATEHCTTAPASFGAKEVGELVKFTVTPDEDFALELVTVSYFDGMSFVVRELTADENGFYSFNMPDADVTITAKAVQNVYSIFTSSDAHTLIEVANGTKAEVGETVLFTVEVTDENYEPNNVLVSTASGKPIALSVIHIDGTFFAYAFTMPADDVMVYADAAQGERTVTFLDSDNTLLGIVPVGAGEYITDVPTAEREGYSFAGWEKLPGKTPFDPTRDAVTENLIVRATYVGDAHTVASGLIENVHTMRAECTVSSGNVNSSDLLQTALNAETGKTVYFTVAANYDYVITDIAVVSAEGTNLVVEPTLREKKTEDNIVYCTYSFTMPAEDVKIDVYTAPKLFTTSVVENIPEGGTYTINGFYTSNLLIPQGKTVTVDITPAEGYIVKNVYGEFTDNFSQISKVDGTFDGSKFTFPMVAKDVIVYIEYEAINYGIDIETSNFASYKPDASVNPAKVVESLDPELTSKGLIHIVGGADRDYTNEFEQIYKIPANGEATNGTRVAFTVEEFTGYDLLSVAVTYANGEKTCMLTYKDGVYYFDMPADDVIITAVFTEETYKVTKDTASEAHGEVVMNGLTENVISADYKDEVTVTVTPEDGWQISRIYYVLADGTVMDFDAASYEAAAALTDALDTAHAITFHMPASDVRVYVEYTAIDYTVNVEKQEAEVEVLYSPSNVGEQVSFEVTANYGYIISKVYVTDDTTGERVYHHTASTSQLYGAWYTFTMPASSVTIHVETVKDEYNVKYLDNGALIAYENIEYMGTANVAAHVDKVVNGKPGYHFIGWVSAEVETPVTVPSVTDSDFVVVKDTFIYAAYARDEIDVLFEATENGTVTELSTGNTAEYRLDTTVFGDTVEFTAVPDEGYVVDTVSVTTTNGEGYNLDIRYTEQDGKYTFVIPASYKDNIHTVQAEDVIVNVTFKKDVFTLTKADDCGTNGTVAVNGAVTTQTSFSYEYQDAVTITATPDNGYYVVSVTAQNADGSTVYTVTGEKPATDTPVGDSLTLSFTMPAEDLTYTVEYAKIDYSITTVFDATQGDVTTEPAGTAQLDDIVTVTVAPKEGYELAELTVTYANGEKTCVLTEIAENVYTFTMPAEPVVVTAIFIESTYTITKAEGCGEDGTVAFNGKVATQTSFSYQYLDEVTITATPDNGYYVVSVTAQNADGSTVYTVTGEKPATDTPVGDSLTLSFTMPAEDLTYTVEYAKIDYSITTVFDATQGDVTTEPAGTAQLDDIVTVTVAPKEGYELAELTVTYADGEKTCVLTEIAENAYTFTMPAEPVVVTAIFTESTYTANLKVVGEGSVTLNGYDTDNIPADYLDTVTVTATPVKGWELASIEVDGGKIKVNEEIKPEGGAYTFTMPSHDVEIVVTFEKTGFGLESYALNFFEEGHGAVTLSPEDTAHVGDRILIAADPDNGYRVKSVTVLDEYGYAVPVSFIYEDADYVQMWSFTMPAAAVEIYVVFEVQGASYYDDVRTDDWFYAAVTFVTDRGYFYGVDVDLFAPYMNMNRAMFVTVLGRMEGVDVSKYTSVAFADVEAGSYYAPYVAWAAENGIVLGRTAEVFDPNADITREEMAAIMYRYCDYLGMDMTIDNEKFMERYIDRGDISDWAVTYIEWAVGAGLIHGMSANTIDPLNYATRAQVAQVIKNLCDKVIYE